MNMLHALVNGTTDAETLSRLALGRAAEKVEQLQKAMEGSVGTHQRDMLRHQLSHIEYLDDEISILDAEIKKKTEFAEEEIALLDEMPGIGRQSAERIIAETGIVMEQFRSADAFASWAGLVPGCHESAGKKANSRIRKGNKFLKSTLVECARAAIRKKDSYYFAKYSKIAARRGGKRALVAVAHSMLLAIYHILKSKQHFVDLGADYFSTIQAERIVKRNINSLQALGFQVSLSALP